MQSYSQIAFALEILKSLVEKPRRRDELSCLLENFLEQRGKSSDDVQQKVSRVISKLRECGFDIRSAPNRPYELIDSVFPVLLAPEQREALAMAAYVLSDMGFSAQAGHIIRIGKLNETQLPPNVKVNFSPPIDYAQERVDEIVQTLQERFRKRRRYTIRYRSARGNEQNWDCDRSELRFHNGVLYLFAHTPDFSPRHEPRPSIEQNQAFRVDRILSIYPPSDTPWGILNFPTLQIRYRMSGPLGNYQPRRANEYEVLRDATAGCVEIISEESYLFWFRQRILQYGSNVQILSPKWIVRQIGEELAKAALNYSINEGEASANSSLVPTPHPSYPNTP